jgi:thiamine monophosphate synthase
VVVVVHALMLEPYACCNFAAVRSKIDPPDQASKTVRDENDVRSDEATAIVNELLILTADRSTHLKVVTLAVIASVVVAIMGFHVGSDNIAVASNEPVVKAGKVIQVTSHSRSEVR